MHALRRPVVGSSEWSRVRSYADGTREIGVSLGDASDGILDILWEFYHTPKPRVIILRTERSLKCSKRRLACAVTQCHAINFPFVMQGCHNPRNLRLWSCDQVESPNDRIDVLVKHHRRLNDPFNSRMRTSYHEDQSFGCLNCQRELTQLQGARRLRHGCDHRYSWCSFRHAIN